MPLVFIHGVNVRKGERYKDNVAERDNYFRRFVLKEIVADPEKATILNPYWGDFGVKFAWDKASLFPQSGIEELGSEEELPIILLNQIQLEEELKPDSVLLQVARKSMTDVIDLLWAVSTENIDESKATELADLAVRAVDYARHNPHPDWLNHIQNDNQFLRDLQQAINDWKPQNAVTSTQEAPQWEVLGGEEAWNLIKRGASRLKRAFSYCIRNGIRAILRTEVANFIGDVFVYLGNRGTEDQPGAIVTEVVKALEAAKNSIHPEDDKLIVVAHSMGGNIIYDILTSFRRDIEVDVLITVGSQVALFEEMKLFRTSDGTITATSQVNRVQKPANVHQWINVFDFNDVLGFATESVFQDVEEFEYRTGKVLIPSHTTYFHLPIFYERLGQRIRNQE